MGTLMEERNSLVGDIFGQYDMKQSGELNADQLQLIHMDMRIGSISIPQIEESIKYICIHEKCEKSELLDILQEMDRRYFLIQDLRWEFSMLDVGRCNAISPQQAEWLVRAVHGKFFSRLRWEKFLKNRAVPGIPVTFTEIEVMLCNVPSKADYLADLAEEQREKEEYDRLHRAAQKRDKEEKERLRKEQDKEREEQVEEEKKKQRDDERRRKEEENERAQKQREKDDAERKRKELDEEEERGQREADKRERLTKEKADKEQKDKKKKRKRKEEKERDRLERMRLEEEDRLRREEAEAGDLEKLYQLAKQREEEAEAEAEEHNKRMKNAQDEATRKDAKEAEDRARLRARDNRHKKIRYNLKIAIKKRDHKRLVTAVHDFNTAKLPDDDKDLPRADRILSEFEARDGLNKSMAQRKIQPLEKAINNAKHKGFEMQLSHELVEANKVLLQLRRLERIRAEILELKQSTVAEIRSYQSPPAVVHTVMTATFLLLGHKEKETTVWKTVQALVGKTGKEGLKRRCLGFEPQLVNPAAAARIKVLMGPYELDEIRDVSAGAATFYLWSTTMVEEFESLQEAKKFEEEEEKKKKKKKKKKEEEVKKVEEGGAEGATAV